MIRQKYWLVPASRRTIQKVIRTCLRCTRFRRGTSESQLMGDLPASRFTVGPVFSVTGVDYAGPIVTRSSPRSRIPTKSYIAVFICFKVRAVHLELVNSLTTDAFLAAFRRFIARRGVPSVMFSDNATNFRGARAELQLIRQFIRRRADDLDRFFTDQRIEWRFIPPGTPHMGGLWESAVKGMKSHLKRVMGAHLLTVDEMGTLLCQIEACLNSRPISPMYEDPESFDALTPGHFLVGRPLGRLLDRADVTQGDIVAPGDRWRLVQTLVVRLWQRWSLEWLNSQRQRPKWRVALDQLAVGDLVVVKSILPPMQWKVGRVVEVLPDRTGVGRIFKVRTPTGTILKHFRYLVPIINTVDDS